MNCSFTLKWKRTCRLLAGSFLKDEEHSISDDTELLTTHQLDHRLQTFSSFNTTTTTTKLTQLTSLNCVGWQVTLCDPIWQVTLHSCVMGFPLRAVLGFSLWPFNRHHNSSSSFITIVIVAATYSLNRPITNFGIVVILVHFTVYSCIPHIGQFSADSL